MGQLHYRWQSAVICAIACWVLPGSAWSLPDAETARYMSAECVRMADAIRNAPRAMRMTNSYREMRDKHYRERCQEEERQAYRQMRESRYSSQVRQMRSRNSGYDQAPDIPADDRVRKVGQCREMKRALENRRNRENPTADDLKTIEIFQQRYDSTCASLDAGRQSTAQ